MPVYEYYCRTCNDRFEKLLPMSAADRPMECPEGHEGAIRTLSLIAGVVHGEGGEMSFSGGCGCGGNCSCGAR